MDNNSGKHPVKDSAEKNMRPAFLAGGESDGESVAEDKIHRSRDAANELGQNETEASKAPGGVGATAGAGLAMGLRKSEAGGGLYSGIGKSLTDGKMGKLGKLGKLSNIKKASAGLGIMLVLLVIPFIMIGNQIFMIGHLDYNLMGSGGFLYTDAALKEQTKSVTAFQLKKGEVPIGYANDLAETGIQVGQVTMAGDFVPTNKYIANIEELEDIAAIGNGFQVRTSEGELAVLFDGKVITAADFAATVDSDPRLYVALEKGADISARYYYSEVVEKIFEILGLKRWAFHAWESTGNAETDQKNYYEILKSVLDGDDEASLEGGYDCSEEGSCSGVNLTGDAEDIIGDFSSENESGAQLLNTAMASVERSKAMRGFLAIEEIAQRARLGENGPVNEMMNTLYDDSVIVTYTDVNTGETIEDGRSIIETANFQAAASDGTFSKSEAANFSLDRGLKATGINGTSTIKSTDVSTKVNGEAKIGVGAFGEWADLYNAESSVQIALSDSNSNLFTSVVGGNRIPGGGGDLNNIINQHAILSLPSDKNAVLAYSNEINTILAKQANAERATMSPFDISSPNTFMGSIVHGFANMMIRNHSSSLPIVSTIGATVDYAGISISGLFNDATAEGDDANYLTTFGDDCQTVPSANSAAASLFCGQANTIYTGLTDKDGDYWKSHKPENYDKYVKNIGDRWSMIGVRDAEICKKDDNPIEDLLSELFGACKLTPEGVATGSDYVLSDSNPEAKNVSAYALYDMVSSLLSEKKTEASMILEDYYAEHPMDNSKVGRIARLSGMTRKETELAFAYADYLNEIASYDASNRYAFGEVEFEMPEKSLLEEHSEKINGDLYCFWRGRNEYGDVRNRNFA